MPSTLGLALGMRRMGTKSIRFKRPSRSESGQVSNWISSWMKLGNDVDSTGRSDGLDRDGLEFDAETLEVSGPPFAFWPEISPDDARAAADLSLTDGRSQRSCDLTDRLALDRSQSARMPRPRTRLGVVGCASEPASAPIRHRPVDPPTNGCLSDHALEMDPCPATLRRRPQRRA